MLAWMKSKLARVLKLFGHEKLIWVSLSAVVLAAILAGVLLPGRLGRKEALPAKISDTTHFVTDEPVTYTAYMPVNNSDQDFSNNPVWLKLQEMTNVRFNFISPIGSDKADELLRLILSAGDAPDLVLNSTAGYPGGYGKAISDGIYIDIRPFLDTDAPHYQKTLQRYRDKLSGIYTDQDALPGFWEIYNPDDALPIVGGLTIRQDYLDQTGLPVPRSIAEWTTLLERLKQIDGVEEPLIFGQQNGVNVTAEFLSAFGIGAAPVSTMNPAHQLFYPVNGQIHYGALEKGYQDYLLLMNEWYQKGLLDQDFGVRTFTDLFERSQLIATGKAAVNWQYSEWQSAFKDENGQTIEMVAAPMPKLNVTDQDVLWMVSRKPNTGKLISITTACQNVVPLIRFFDFLYSDEGIMLQNFGIENDTYVLENQRPVYTSKITAYPKGPFEGVGKYINNNSAVMFNLMYSKDVQKQLYGENALAMKDIWLDSAQLFNLDVDLEINDSTRLIRIMSGITNYVTEYTIKAIIDKNVALDWNEHVMAIHDMGIDEAISIMQRAYDQKQGRTE